MRKLILPIVVAGAVAGAMALPALASAQASATVQLRLNLPVLLPRLVVVTPGVQVVPDVDEEVFFVDGYYWVRQPRGWYRSRSHQHGWVMMPARRVPSRLVVVPAGKYRRYKPAKHEGRHESGHGHDHGRGNGHGEGKGHGNGKHGGKH